MECETLFSGAYKKNIMNLSLPVAQRELINLYCCFFLFVHEEVIH